MKADHQTATAFNGATNDDLQRRQRPTTARTDANATKTQMENANLHEASGVSVIQKCRARAATKTFRATAHPSTTLSKTPGAGVVSAIEELLRADATACPPNVRA